MTSNLKPKDVLFDINIEGLALQISNMYQEKPKVLTFN